MCVCLVCVCLSLCLSFGGDQRQLQQQLETATSKMQIVTYAVARTGVYVSCGGVFSVWLSLGGAQRLVCSVHTCVRAQAHTYTHVGLKSDAGAGGFTAALEKSEETRRDTPKYTSTRTILSPVVLSLFFRCVPSLHVSLTIFMYILVYFYSC